MQNSISNLKMLMYSSGALVLRADVRRLERKSLAFVNESRCLAFLSTSPALLVGPQRVPHSRKKIFSCSMSSACNGNASFYSKFVWNF